MPLLKSQYNLNLYDYKWNSNEQDEKNEKIESARKGVLKVKSLIEMKSVCEKMILDFKKS